MRNLGNTARGEGVKGMSSFEEKQAMSEQLDNCTPDAWKALVRYMAKELTIEQEFLAELICREAHRRGAKKRVGTSLHSPAADYIAGVLADVGLRIVLADSGEVGNEQTR